MCNGTRGTQTDLLVIVYVFCSGSAVSEQRITGFFKKGMFFFGKKGRSNLNLNGRVLVVDMIIIIIVVSKA
jgi:hypothetical protein